MFEAYITEKLWVLKGEGDRSAIAIGPLYLQVTSHKRYVLIAERDASQNSCKSVQLKGVCHQRVIHFFF